jgi:exodeoxyribonuclease V gamma subunit
MFKLVQSNDLHVLANVLCDDLRSPLAPFTPETILIQSLGIAQWLRQRVADQLGIAANLQLELPASYLWAQYQTLLQSRFQEPLDRDALAIRVLKSLPHIQAPILEQFRASRPKSQRGDFELAQQLGSVFENYLLYRPDWVLEWQAGKQPVNHPDADWQALIWQSVTRIDPLLAENHRARLHVQWLDRLNQSDAMLQLPARLSLFGLSTLAPMQLDAFEALARHIPVTLYFLNPCEHYWGDFITQRTSARQAAKAMDAGYDPELLLLDAGHPLLAHWGRLGQEFHERLTQHEPDHSVEQFSSKSNETTLGRLQASILEATIESASPVQEGEATLPADDSIEIHRCHGPLRECEVLLDQLFTLVETDDSALDNTLVMAPDIDEYVSHIHSVFSDRLPYTIADQRQILYSTLVPTYLLLLALPTSRLTASGVIDLLQHHGIQRRFDLSPTDIQLIERWIGDANIHFEWDGAQKKDRWGLPDTNQFTWQFGLYRIIAGFLTGRKDELIAGGAAIGIPGEEANTLDKFLGFLDLLTRTRDALSQSGTVSSWSDRLNRLLTDWFDLPTEQAAETQTITQAIERWSRLLIEADFQDALTSEWVLAWFHEKLGEPRGLMHMHQRGVTFATLVPLRSIPFDHVFILGLNADSFPRTRHRPSFDLLENTPRRLGDRSLRDDDRYLFLEAINATQKKLRLSFVGRDQRDNSEIPPSLVVTELIDCMAAMGEVLHITDHPLQPFSSRYRSGELTTYQGHWWTPVTLQSIEAIPPSSSMPGDNHVEGEALIRFAQHSGQSFFEEGLDAGLRIFDRTLQESEPFEFDALDRYLVLDQCVDALLSGLSVQTLTKQLVSQGRALEGPWGERQLATTLRVAERMVEKVTAEARDTRRMQPIACFIDEKTITLNCQGIRDADHLHVRAGRWTARQLMRPWIAHLLLHASGSELPGTLLGAESGEIKLSKLSPLSTDDAKNALAPLLKLYDASQTQPAFLPIESTWAYFSAIQSGKDTSSAMEAARQQWDGQFYGPNEKSDPYWARIDGTLADIPRLSTLLEPFLAALFATWGKA